MYTRVLLENGILLVHREGVHVRHHRSNISKGMALSKKRYPYASN